MTVVVLLFSPGLTVVPDDVQMFSCLVDFIITKQSGGRWRFEIELESSKPDMDGLLVVEASVGQVGKLPLHLNTQGNEPVKFQAHMTQDSDLDLDVFPKAGTLYPADGKDEEGQAETTKPALTVTYKNTGYGKNANGCLVIETDESEYTYQVKGTITKYMPPDPKTVTSKLTTKQDSQLLAKLKGAAPRKDKNFVAAAARGGTGRRNVGEGP